MSLLTLLSVAGAFVNVAQAYSASDVAYVYNILNDLPGTLASPFCSSYAHAIGGVSTVTVAEATTTTTLGCNEVPSGYPGYGKPPKTYDAPYPGITDAPYNPNPNDPIDWWVTSTTTTTITVTTYSTTTIFPGAAAATNDPLTGLPVVVYVSPTDSALAAPTGGDLGPYEDLQTGPVIDLDGGMADFNYPQPTDAAPWRALKRSAKFLFKRQAWCGEINRPCRLALYDEPSIIDACSQYLGGSSAITVTTTIYSTTATETSKFCTPGSGDYHPEETGSPYPDDSESSEDYGEKGEDEGSYGDEESGEEGSEYGGGEDFDKPTHSGKPSHGKPSQSGKPSHGKPSHSGKPSEPEGDYPSPSGSSHGEHGGHGEHGSHDFSYPQKSSALSWGEGYPTATETSYGAYGYASSTPAWGSGYPTATESAYGAEESGKPEGEHGHGGPGGEHGPPGQHGPPGHHGPPGMGGEGKPSGQWGPSGQGGESYPSATGAAWGAEASGKPEDGHGGLGGQHGPPGQGGEGKPNGPPGPPGAGGPPAMGGQGEKQPPKGYCLVKKPQQQAWGAR